MAQRFWPNLNSLGQPIPDELAELADLGRDVQIVGVVRDTKSLWSPRGDLAVYIPYTQASPQQLGQMKFFVRTAGNPMSVVPAVRQQIQSIEKDLPLVGIATQADEVIRQAGEERSMAMLLGFFSALALVLSSIGLYGTMSYAVSRRTRELGIRLALGAQRKDVLRMVLREALQQVVIGMAIGIPVALAVARMIASMLFGVKTTDPVTISVAVLVMGTVAFVAGYLPPGARRRWIRWSLSDVNDAAMIHGFDGSLRIITDRSVSVIIRSDPLNPCTNNLREICKHFGKTCATARECCGSSPSLR